MAEEHYQAGKLLHSLVIAAGDPLLTTRQRECGYYALLVALNSPLMLYYFVTEDKHGLESANQQSLYKRIMLQMENNKSQGASGKEMLLLDQISQKVAVYKACQNIANCKDRIIHQVGQQTAEKTQDNGKLNQEMYGCVVESMDSVDHLRLQLLRILALEQLDDLDGTNTGFVLNTHIGPTISYQQLSSVSFELFSQFKTMECIIALMFVVICHSQTLPNSSIYLKKCLDCIGAHLVSRRGTIYLANVLHLQATASLNQCYWVCRCILFDVLDNELPNTGDNAMLKSVCEKLLQHLCQNYDEETTINTYPDYQSLSLVMDNYPEAYGCIFDDSTGTLQSLCNNILYLFPASSGIIHHLIDYQSKTVRQVASRLLVQLSCRINAYIQFKILYAATSGEGNLTTSGHPVASVIPNEGLKALAAMSKSNAGGQEAAAQCVLDFHLFPIVLNGLLANDAENKQCSLVLAGAVVQSTRCLSEFMNKTLFANAREVLALFPSLWILVEPIEAYHNDQTLMAIENCALDFLRLTSSWTLLADPSILRNLIVCLQLSLRRHTLAIFQAVAGYIFGDRNPDKLFSNCQAQELEQLTLSQMLNLQATITKHLRALMQIEHQSMSTFQNSRLIMRKDSSAIGAENEDKLYMQALGSLCELLDLLSILIRRTCEVAVKQNSDAWRSSKVTDNCNSMAKLLADTTIESLCVLDELHTMFVSCSNYAHNLDLLPILYRTRNEMTSMLHHQCSIIIDNTETESCNSEEVETTINYWSIGLCATFGRCILDNCLRIMLARPSSALTCLNILREVLPDRLKEDFGCLDVPSQQLRLYWRTMAEGSTSNFLKLRYFIGSNHRRLSLYARNVLSQILGLFCATDEFSRRLKMKIHRELTSRIAYVVDARKHGDIFGPNKLRLFQNEVALRRWLEFTSENQELQEFNTYFSTALEQVKLPEDEFRKFSDTQGI